MSAVYWTGTIDKCQITDQPLGNVMYDCRIPVMGVWANVGQDVFDQFECRLGTGLGQKYEKQPDGRWLKVEG